MSIIAVATVQTITRIKKKKSRAAKIGMGSNNNDTPATSPSPPPPVAPTPTVAPIETKSARDDALEAARRAEDFMRAKTVEDVGSLSKLIKESTTVAVSKIESATNLVVDTHDSMDEVLAAAKVAAEKAKILQNQQKGKGGGFMGTFFF